MFISCCIVVLIGLTGISDKVRCIKVINNLMFGHQFRKQIYDKLFKVKIFTDVDILLPIDNGFVSQPQQIE